MEEEIVAAPIEHSEITEKLEAKPKAGNPNWGKGISANPAGKPRGTKNRTTLIKQAIEFELMEKLAMDANSILMKTIELAKAGDVHCIKILMDRLLPVLKQADGTERTGINSISINIQPIANKGSGVTIDADTGSIED